MVAFYIDQAFIVVKLYGFGEAKHQLKNMEGKTLWKTMKTL